MGYARHVGRVGALAVASGTGGGTEFVTANIDSPGGVVYTIRQVIVVPATSPATLQTV